ncbi:DUF6497 family protein [Roseovarius amoyensis]|uniref:DUF6497 family protein n=1 Tax=Roseovarius amoyensis TaxID=2211448 RepID=UPI000DBE092E|nr:DUF6497 family protein [Roseovarius amoyensis]
MMAVSMSGVVAAEPGRVALPSGLEAMLQETIREEGPVLRFRYVAAGFDAAAPLDEVAADLEHLCAADAAKRAAAEGMSAARLVVSLADKPSEFGRFNPDVRQVFEAYRLENGICIWEAF